MHKSAMQMHARELSGRSEVKPHQCQQCLKSFSSNHQLVQHIRVHTGEKPYKCSYCDRRFKQLSHVQQHTRLHTATCERQFACYRSSDFSIDDKPRSGRPPQLDIERLRTVVEANSYGTTREMAREFGYSQVTKVLKASIVPLKLLKKNTVVDATNHPRTKKSEEHENKLI
ncbi:hypothetical protein NQ318_001997 [Aromia moschata]|uniref:C2H2-type domain-containing protein n=1 Tax=Aromia moschata TaxID=1265417 RepID=A0AAV8Z269_9CUCU|nr:hypothetical protein NQ318_001997 [Aromia moschata]